MRVFEIHIFVKLCATASGVILCHSHSQGRLAEHTTEYVCVCVGGGGGAIRSHPEATSRV